jgi:hypothetical protein
MFLRREYPKLMWCERLAHFKARALVGELL